MRQPIEKIKARLEDIWEEAVLLERDRERHAQAKQKAYEQGQQDCPVCFHRESGGTDEETMKRVIDELEAKFPKSRKVIEHIKQMQ